MIWNIKQLEDHLLIGSTLVEGSTLTESEAREILQGRTVQGHHVSEVRELLNYRSSVEWFALQVTNSPYISIDLVLGFHLRLFSGFPGEHGKFKTQINFTYRTDGERHEYVKPGRVAQSVSQWLAGFNEDKESKAAAEQAAKLYYAFENIHPFEDGNGRIGRILIAYWLKWKHQLHFSFYAKDKTEHLRALEDANCGHFGRLEGFFLERLSKEEL